MPEDRKSRKLTPKEKALYRITDEVLHYIWDPIGVAGAASARDEYYGYFPHVFGLLRREDAERAIAEYLVAVERDRMGMKPNPDRALRVARILISHRNWIDQMLEK